jgi:hypothetical protein
MSFNFSIPFLGGSRPPRATAPSKHTARSNVESTRRQHDDVVSLLDVNLAPIRDDQIQARPLSAGQESGSNQPQTGESIGKNTRTPAPLPPPLPVEVGSMTAPTLRTDDTGRSEVLARQPEAHPLYSSRDLTLVPAALDSELMKTEQGDYGGAVRPTSIKPGEDWQRSRCKTMLSAPETSSLQAEQLGRERNEAFDLLDVLTK